MKKMKAVFSAAVFVLASLVYMGCSNSSSDDGGGGTGSVDLPSDYSGTFKVDGKSYAFLSFADGGYTLEGVGGKDTGTYAGRSARSLSDGSYTLTSSKGGSFIVEISGSTIEFKAGSKSASGKGGNIYAVVEPPLPASSGDDPFTGKSFLEEHHSGTDVWAFSNGVWTETDRYGNETVGKYSWNTSKNEYYRTIESMKLSALEVNRRPLWSEMGFFCGRCSNKGKVLQGAHCLRTEA